MYNSPFSYLRTYFMRSINISFTAPTTVVFFTIQAFSFRLFVYLITNNNEQRHQYEENKTKHTHAILLFI